MKWKVFTLILLTIIVILAVSLLTNAAEPPRLDVLGITPTPRPTTQPGPITLPSRPALTYTINLPLVVRGSQ